MWTQRKFKDTPVLWEPKGAGMRMKKFQKSVEEKYNLQFNDYWEIQKWSVDNTVEYWSQVFDFLGIICSKKYEKVIDLSVPMSESPKWFEGARLNYAENLLKYRDDHIALILAGEERDIEKITYAKRYEEVELYAAAFRKFGLKKNDIVACYMSNRKEAMFAMLAVVSIGAVWTGALPIMAPQPFLDRLEQVKPQVLLAVDRFIESGEEIDLLPKIKIIVQGLPSLQKVIIVPSKENSKFKDISEIRSSCFLDDFLELGRMKDGSVPPMEFEQVPFSHPIFISYTSGTTGKPKALVHDTGILLVNCQHFSLCQEINREDIYTSTNPVGWSSWNMLATLSFFGYTLILYEGCPYFVTPTYIWDLVDKLQITNLCLSSYALNEFQKRGYVPGKNHCLSSLQNIIVSGSIVKPQHFDFVYEKIGRTIPLNAYYGCTEIMACCLVAVSTLPVYRGELSGSDLGCLIECLDESGEPVLGQVGELYLSKPLPSLPVGMWGDPDGSLYRKNYFSKYPGKFCIGDNAVINPFTKGFVLLGRSDETLKQRGNRFGSSDIYNILEDFPEISDSLCVSQFNQAMHERAVLFLKISGGHRFSVQLISRIREAIAKELTEEHVPDLILETKDIPYNLIGKKMEILVKKIINKMPHTAETVSNKESLEFYYNIPDLQAPF